MKSKIIVAHKDIVHVIDQSQIIYCQSDNSYTNLYLLNGQKILVVKSLAKFSAELDSSMFIRVNQSFLINKEYIQTVNKRNKTIDLLNNYSVPFTVSLKALLMLIS